MARSLATGESKNDIRMGTAAGDRSDNGRGQRLHPIPRPPGSASRERSSENKPPHNATTDHRISIAGARGYDPGRLA